MLPDNDIRLKPDITISLEQCDKDDQMIANGRITGYFKGDIDGMGDQKIEDGPYSQ